MRIRSVAVIVSLAASLLATPAFAAATYTWNTESGGVTSNGSLVFGANGNSGEKIKVRAYQISNLGAGAASFTTASIGQYSGGLGITSTNETQSSPHHAIDNNTSSGRYEFLLIEFDDANTKNIGFEIGWKDDSRDSDFQVWVGNGAAGLNLTNANACGASCDFTELGLMGFTHTESFTNVSVGSTKTVSGQISGRYLLIAGRLQGDDGYKDYGKVSGIYGTQYTDVPEPTSLALFAAAAVGAGFARRKRRRAA